MRALHVSAVLTLTLLIVAAPAAVAQTEPQLPVLVAIRAAHHPGFDRLVFEFEGRLPESTTATWTDRVRHDGSGLPVAVHGNAFLSVVLFNVLAHEDGPGFESTYGPRQRAFDLPNIAHVVSAGDFEATVSFGVGLMDRTRIIRTSRLRDPSRFVIDVSSRYDKERVSVTFLDREAIDAGTPPFLASVSRTVPRSRPRVGEAESALLRLWAGPTQEEKAAGIRFRPSATTGFRDFRLNDAGVARLTLKGRCNGHGAALTGADQVMATLDQFRAIDWVKLYDRTGQTEEPTGQSDSIPDCLAS
jgi:hypothetical protein